MNKICNQRRFVKTVKMEVAECIKASTPHYGHSFRHENMYYKIEDSGYTSFSPGAVELTDENSDSVSYISFPPSAKRRRLNNVYVACDAQIVTPRSSPPRRRVGVKRTYPEDSSNPTPTREISRKIQRLKVDENASSPTINSTFISSPGHLHYSDALIFPTTPRKSCESNCKVSPYKKGKQLNFSVHSLACENLPPISPRKSQAVSVCTLPRRFYGNVNILKNLCDYSIVPPLKIIFDYLNYKDINNLSIAYPEVLKNIYDILPDVEKRQQAFSSLLIRAKENQIEAKEKNILKNIDNTHRQSLKEIKNVLEVNVSLCVHDNAKTKNTLCKKANPIEVNTKRQLCVQCWCPAIVKEEPSGEKWVDCTKTSCLYQFCKLCKCERHPGEKCSIQNDLEAPSPPKRKKVNTKDYVGTKKSRRTLRRLQME